MYSKYIAALLSLLVFLGVDIGQAAPSEQTETQAKTRQNQAVESLDLKSTPASAAQTEEYDYLSAEEAEAIALSHAAVDADSVTVLHTEPDFAYRTLVWDVEFHTEDWEYDYTIHAVSGEVLKQERDYEPQKRTEKREKPVEPTPAKPAEPVIPAPQTPESKNLTADAAEEIALSHAGLSRTAVRGLRTELDRDDGRPVYEIEFRDGAVEYEYEIHAQTGAVLDWDRDYDD